MDGAPIGIVAALPEELGGLKRRIDGLRPERIGGRPGFRGELGGRQVVCVAAGAGRHNAARGLAALLEQAGIAGVVGVGVAGGLSPALVPGDCFWACEVLRADEGAPSRPDPSAKWVAPRERGADPSAMWVAPGGGPSAKGVEPRAWKAPRWELQRRAAERLRKAVVVESPEIASTAGTKAGLWAASGRAEPAVVDLESAAWASVAEEGEVPWLILRAVSDTAEEELPLDLEGFRDATGDVDRRRVFRHAALRPSLWRPLAGLRRRADLCAARLAIVVEEILAA